MNRGWKRWRPAIWLGMIGLAVMLLTSPPYFGVLLIGAGIGAAIRIRQQDRRAARAAPDRSRAPRRNR
ncbi:MAG TPA: hypothetical protein VG405_11125 [Solirubrobacteraceae bacterium]|nr:hypothetical protein [Solirubrobacteraceae bacterium]